MTDGDRVECLAFETPAGRFAVETGWVRELVELGEVTPVPGTPPTVAGVTSLRGSIVVVLSGAALLGVDEERLLVFEREDDRRPVGLTVGAVAAVETIETTAITTPAAFDGEGPNADVPVKAVLLPFGRDGTSEPTFVLDVAALGEAVPAARGGLEA
ncbi:chemotaxis protein CheW [Halorubellus salinus]|uniref:chemotaxis protein CheW n=1 Tax=Halorubellus salinus TaxID=755309 RepID=UPI001D08B926